MNLTHYHWWSTGRIFRSREDSSLGEQFLIRQGIGPVTRSKLVEDIETHLSTSTYNGYSPFEFCLGFSLEEKAVVPILGKMEFGNKVSCPLEKWIFKRDVSWEEDYSNVGKKYGIVIKLPAEFYAPEIR